MVDPVLTAAQNASGNTTNLGNTGLTTNFNVTPYYDDYDPNDQYYRILYKPGFAVQARELTQMQSMLQSQIYRMGRHVFKDGTIVLPGGFRVRTNAGEKKGEPIDYVKIKTTNASNVSVNVNDLVGSTLTGATSNIKAYVIDVADSDGTTQNTKTVYVSYLSASPVDSNVRTFLAGETLTSANNGGAIVLDSDPVANTGYASWFQIQEGVYFAKEHFIYFPTQSVVLDRYNPNPTCKVGFIVSEEIVNYNQDSNLLDPALEASNYSAPGADRFKLASTLSVLSIDDAAGLPDFVTLFTIKDGIMQMSREKTDYNILGDAIAERTYNESGDYVVRGLNVQVQEHDRVESPINNQGRYANGNNQLLIVNVDPGVGYVKGYQVSNQDIVSIEVEKPTEYNNVASQITSTSMGQYLRVNEAVGSWQLDQGARVNFYDLVQKRITNDGVSTGQKWSVGAQTGNLIGSAVVNSVQYTGSGTLGYDAQYDIFLSDIKMIGANSTANIRSLYYDNTPHSDVGADVVGASNSTSNTTLRGLAQATLLYYVGSNSVKTARDINGDPTAIYNFNRTDGIAAALTFSTSGTATITLSGPANEQIPYGTVASLSQADKTQDFLVTLNQTFNIGPLWSATITSNGTRYLTSANANFTRMNVGDKIELGNNSNTWYISAISDDNHIMVSNTVPSYASGNLVFKAYKTGDIINMAGKGVLVGTERTIAATPTSLAFDLKETFPSTVSATITYQMASTQSKEVAKLLRPNRFVKINCSTAGTSGPFSLGFADVYQIRNVIKKTGSAPSSLSDGTNVTRYFTLDNGQKDVFYDIGKLKKFTGYTLGATDFLLIELDYFEPSFSGRAGFFTVDSYPIQDNDANSSNSTIRTENIPLYISPTTGQKYDLRNNIDFRPIKAATANDTTVVASATINPSSNSSSYSFGASGLKFPVPSTEVIYDYSYYLGRKDVVIGTKDNRFAVVKGTSSATPLIPETSDNNMILAVINVPPYPTVSPTYGNNLGRRDLACSVQKVSNRRYTMRDIGVLENRIKNLEYYTGLTMLEKDALNLKITDDAGNDRFKNGIFLDTFKDTSLSAKGANPDFRIVVDPNELSLVPLYTQESWKHEYISGSTTGTAVAVNNNIITFAYTETSQFAQPKVTDHRLLERGTFFYKGALDILPKQDMWIDTTYAPDEIVKIEANNSGLSISVGNSANGWTDDKDAQVTKSLLNTDWESWKQHITGYKLYKGEGASKVLYGTYANEEEARNAAATWTTKQNQGSATLETLYYNDRIGTSYYANYSTDDAAGSYKMISSTKIPYIRPQTLYVIGTGLKPYSKVKPFFDGVNVSAYCRPLTYKQFAVLAAGYSPIVGEYYGSLGDPLIVDDIGRTFFEFHITKDGPRFRTGERRLYVLDGDQIDPQQISEELDASTTASGIFCADGTAQTLQRTVYSTAGYERTYGPAYEDLKDQHSYAVMPNTWKPPPKHGHCCFNPEAKVLMADKTWKAIQDIVEGEKVLGDNGQVNTVQKVNAPRIEDRKLIKFKGIDGTTFFSTDDHLFMTDKGWKTWDIEAVKKSYDDGFKIDYVFLENDNKTCSIDHNDKLKVIKPETLSYDFVPYEGEIGMHGYTSEDLVYDLTLDGNMTYIVEGYVVHNCCVAYVVFIKAPDEEEGMFVTSMDIFIHSKSTTRGLWFEIREVDKGGGITPTTIPGSSVHYENADIVVSPNGKDSPMHVVFPRPVFLFKDTNYAFIVHSDSPSPLDVDPDTSIWISRLGETDINTGQKVSDRQATGTFYQTLNNRSWDLIDGLDLTCNIYRAVFPKDTTANFIIGNEPVEKFFMANTSTSLSGKVGSWFTTGDTLTVTGANGTIALTDRVQGNNSIANANGNVVNVISATQFAVSKTRYQIGEKVNIYYSSNSTYKCSATVTAISNSAAKLSYYNESASSIYGEFKNSTGGFKVGSVISDMIEGTAYSAQVTSINDYAYGAFSYEPTVLDFVKTNIKYEMRTYANGSISAGNYNYISPSDTTYLSDEKALYSRTNELINIGGNKSNQIRVTLITNSEYVSPVYDLDTSHTIFLDSLINSDYSGEDGKSGGNAINKYISQIVTLADGQDAEDLKVYLTAYRPPNTDVKVYVKLLHASDTDPFDQKYWIEMTKNGTGDSLYSSISDRNNFREFVYNLPTSIMVGPDGQSQYTSNGIAFNGYKQFAVKVILLGDNSSIYPRVADLRCIAVQM